MRRALIAALFVLGFGLAGGFTAGVVAATNGTTSTGTGTDTASTATGTDTTSTATTTTTPTTTTKPPPKPKPKPKPVTIAAGVTIGGTKVGRMTPAAATAAVRKAFLRPLPLVVAGTRYRSRPSRFGAIARIKLAVAHARSAESRTDVPLVITVQGSKVRAFVDNLALRFDRLPVDARLSLRHDRPSITKDVPGRTLLRRAARQAIARSFVRGKRNGLKLEFARVPASVTRASFGALIVIQRASNRLTLFNGMRAVRSFGVATGQAVYPTPLGKFSIVVKWVNPWWYPPDSAWAKGEKPVPPGPGNPLGTRWMGLSAAGVGIHGTPNDSSIGYSESHGCIRMHIPEAEWLFTHVDIGTTVYIVNA